MESLEDSWPGEGNVQGDVGQTLTSVNPCEKVTVGTGGWRICRGRGGDAAGDTCVEEKGKGKGEGGREGREGRAIKEGERKGSKGNDMGKVMKERGSKGEETKGKGGKSRE